VLVGERVPGRLAWRRLDAVERGAAAVADGLVRPGLAGVVVGFGQKAVEVGGGLLEALARVVDVAG
jgi:hypothetical protein